MNTLPYPTYHERIFSTFVVLLGLLVVTIGVARDSSSKFIVFVAVAAAALAAHRTLLRWDVLFAGLIALVFFLPMRRWVVPSNLPFEIEPYRLLIAFVIAGWFASALVDPRVRLRSTGFEAPLFLVVFATLASVAANGKLVEEMDTQVAKSLMFFFTFVLVFFVLNSVLRTQAALDVVLKVLIVSAMIVGLAAIYESRTEFNAFDWFAAKLPFLEQIEGSSELLRGGRFRALGSSEHPIALSAVLTMLVPFTVYLAKKYGRLWWVIGGLLTIGAVAPVSRTGILMFAVIAVTFLILRRREMMRAAIPMLLPAIVAVHFALPGAIGTLKDSFFPPGGLLAEQTVRNPWDKTGGGRLADVGPALREFSDRPLVGQGLGTRQTTFQNGRPPNSIVLDDQWLALLLEIGAAGTLAWAWLFVRFLRRTGRRAKAITSTQGWLYVALVASVASYAIGMLTYDAFSFVQVTFVLYMVMAIGAAALALDRRDTASQSSPAPATHVALTNPSLHRTGANGLVEPGAVVTRTVGTGGTLASSLARSPESRLPAREMDGSVTGA